MQEEALLRLLQLADSALPIGGTAHSYGLETLTSEDVLHPEDVEQFLQGYLEEAGALDALFVRHAWQGEDPVKLAAEFVARKPARESREASRKLGRRFADLVNALADAPLLDLNLPYPVAFGLAGAALAVPEDATVLAYLNQSVTGFVSSFQRLLPLGQTAAARIVWNLKPAIGRASTCQEVSCFTPLPEIASMRHGSLETRLFIS